MNRSYSKIRHIQEVNKIIEKRLLNEVEDMDTSDIVPDQSEIEMVSIDPQKNLYRDYGKDLVELYKISKKTDEFVKFVTDKGYKKLPKRIEKIYQESRGRSSAYDDRSLIWLGKKYWKDTELRNKVEELKKS